MLHNRYFDCTANSIDFKILTTKSTTNLLIVSGLIVGAIIRFGLKSSNKIEHLQVVPPPGAVYNQSIPPDILWFEVQDTLSGTTGKNKTYAYSFRGEILKQDSEIDKKVCYFRNCSVLWILFVTRQSFEKFSQETRKINWCFIGNEINFSIKICVSLLSIKNFVSGHVWSRNIFQHHPAADNFSRRIQLKKGKIDL